MTLATKKNVTTFLKPCWNFPQQNIHFLVATWMSHLEPIIFCWSSSTFTHCPLLKTSSVLWLGFISANICKGAGWECWVSRNPQPIGDGSWKILQCSSQGGQISDMFNTTSQISFSGLSHSRTSNNTIGFLLFCSHFLILLLVFPGNHLPNKWLFLKSLSLHLLLGDPKLREYWKLS